MEWYAVPREEQETIVNIDYEERTLEFYTARKSVANKLLKRVGKPDGIETTENKICAVSYKRKLSDKDIRNFLSVGTLICGFRQTKDKE